MIALNEGKSKKAKGKREERRLRTLPLSPTAGDEPQRLPPSSLLPFYFCLLPSR
jgi:hypothetical protein